MILYRTFTFVIFLGCQITSHANGACFFPTELQGEFVMQSISVGDSKVQYSRLNITAEAIPIWGSCHRRIGNSVILMESFSGANCIRCFQLTLRSKNIMLVTTEGLDKCYMSEEAAEATCPHNTNSNNLKEILLYKAKEPGGEEIHKEYCPIHGKYTFVYNINDGSENEIECDTGVSSSRLDTCSSLYPASSIHLNFKGCSFGDHEINFLCLGDWQGPDNQRYMALYDTRTTTLNSPQYRCAMYHMDPSTKNVFVAFSSDSTCVTNLHNSTSGYETLILKPLPEPSWPPKVAASSGRLPDWTQGNWEHMNVIGHTITYRDHFRFQTLKIRVMGIDSKNDERFPVYIRDECGGESYSCIWLKRRGVNVLEFQLGINPVVVYNDSLCSDSNFQSKVWITQGRLERIRESPCPITGEYTGFIPDEGDRLCAKLSSDCKSPEIMYYTLSECTEKDVYEEREYRCLGQWVENGLTYTYTQRRDIGIYECFVGSIISNNEIYIKEAGEHCERDLDPLHLGMKLSSKGACTDSDPSPVPWGISSPHPGTERPPSVTWQHPTRHPPHATKTWKPITAPPRIKNEILNGIGNNKPYLIPILMSFLFSFLAKQFLVFNCNYLV